MILKSSSSSCLGSLLLLLSCTTAQVDKKQDASPALAASTAKSVQQQKAILQPMADNKRIEAENADLSQDRLVTEQSASGARDSSISDADSAQTDDIAEADIDADSAVAEEPAGFMEEDLTPETSTVEQSPAVANTANGNLNGNENDLNAESNQKQANNATNGNDSSTTSQQISPEGMSELYRSAIEHKDHPYVAKWVDYFSRTAKDRFQRYLNRGYIYRPMIEEVLAKQGVPKEMFYLALIESGFHNNATSRAKAVGVWQFISATGRRYGLEVNNVVDERRDPIRATIAAAAYLNDLFRVYQDWNLAMAGYNAGEMRILRAVMNTSARDFWTLIDQNKLPKETMNYVPKFLAAMIVGENAKYYGFVEPTTARYPALKVAEINTRASLRDIAKLYNVNESTLRLVNPHLRKGTVPLVRGGYKVWLPSEDTSETALAQLQDTVNVDLKANRDSRQKSPRYSSKTTASDAVGQVWHKVRRGENLTSIARKYNVAVANLRQANRITSNRLSVGKVLRIPLDASVSNSDEGSDGSEKIGSNEFYQEKRSNFYQVKSGDSLYTIAKKFGTTVGSLKKMNNLARGKLFVGQRLMVMR